MRVLVSGFLLMSMSVMWLMDLLLMFLHPIRYAKVMFFISRQDVCMLYVGVYV